MTRRSLTKLAKLMDSEIVAQVPLPDESLMAVPFGAGASSSNGNGTATPPAVAAKGTVHAPSYGRWLEEFREGAVHVHPRALTIYASFAQEFATTFHEANPIYLADPIAREHGYAGLAVSPWLVLNVALSLGVQNDSEKATAHLGYQDGRFLRPVYPGDTLRSVTKVVGVRERDPGKPGVVHLRTVGLNQRGEAVLVYDRRVLVPRAPAREARAERPPAVDLAFPEMPAAALVPAPHNGTPYPADATGGATYLDDFAPGDVILHPNGRTVTDEHIPWTYRVGNTHPLHYDRLYSKTTELGGEPVVYGGLVLAWVAGLASRDTTENALFELGFTEGYHTAPVRTGDTIAALSRVLEVGHGERAGAVRFQLVGVKNLTAREAWEKHGAALFGPGKEKVADRILTIERSALVKKRP